MDTCGCPTKGMLGVELVDGRDVPYPEEK